MARSSPPTAPTGVILATATGSTGYAMAVGGPVLEPQSRQLVLAPVSPHLSMSTPLVLGEESRVALEIAGGGGAVVSLDGHNDHDLGPGDLVRASKSAKTAKVPPRPQASLLLRDAGAAAGAGPAARRSRRRPALGPAYSPRTER